MIFFTSNGCKEVKLIKFMFTLFYNQQIVAMSANTMCAFSTSAYETINKANLTHVPHALSLCTTYIYNIGTTLVKLTPLLSTIHQDLTSRHRLASLPYLIPFGLCEHVQYFYKSNSLLPREHHLFFPKPPEHVLLSSSNCL